ncbi:MAG: hypothetical protein LUF78_01150 [Clostridiales bacterium]|nr:hypothetical protein [Clostridiales bacterium]
MRPALRNHFHMEREKIKDLTFREKAAYILEYYWLWIAGPVLGMVLIVYILYHMFFTVKEYWFYAVYANTTEDGGNGSRLWEDFLEYGGFDLSEKNLEMNASMYFDPSVSGGSNNSYYQSFVALAEAGSLDVLVMGEAGLQAVGSSGWLLDLKDDSASELREKYEDRFVWCQPGDEEYGEESVPVGIDISDSLLVTEYHLYEDVCVLGVGAHTRNMDGIETFLEFILQGTEEKLWEE